MSYASLLKLIRPETLPELLTHRRQLSTNQRETGSRTIDERDADATREQCKRLVGFIKAAWCHIPELADKVYEHGWHVDVIALHLEAISSGKLLRMKNRTDFFQRPPRHDEVSFGFCVLACVGVDARSFASIHRHELPRRFL